MLFSALAWLVAILLTGLFAGVLVHAPQWTLVLIAVFFSLSVVTYLTAYVLYLIAVPEAFRVVEAEAKRKKQAEPN